MLVLIFIGFLLVLSYFFYTRPTIYVGQSSIANKGVFANRFFQTGDLIEHCAALQVPWDQRIEQTILRDYAFEHPKEKEKALVAHGQCGLYNHSNQPNAKYVTGNQSVTIYATKPIFPGQEIFVSYGDAYWTSRNLTPK